MQSLLYQDEKQADKMLLDITYHLFKKGPNEDCKIKIFICFL